MELFSKQSSSRCKFPDSQNPRSATPDRLRRKLDLEDRYCTTITNIVVCIDNRMDSLSIDFR